MNGSRANGAIVEHYDGAPSAFGFMLRALLPSPRLSADLGLPPIGVRWSGLRIEASDIQAYCLATGSARQDGIPLLLPHVIGFRLQMALLTHRAYPLPIWTALQIRNRLVRHRAVAIGEALDLDTRVGEHRRVDNGIEVDLLSRLMRGSECCWESRITYFHRGRFDVSPTRETSPSPDLAEVAEVERFRLPKSGGWRFGHLTGDYNGIHWWRWYARRFGFAAAFLHPQRSAGMCLARLRGPEAEAQTLDLWIKGPLFYGADVVLRGAEGEGGVRFGLSLVGDPRTALAGSWRGGAAEVR